MQQKSNAAQSGQFETTAGFGVRNIMLKGQQKTSFSLWIISFIMTILFYSIRLPQVIRSAKEQVPEELKDAQDPATIEAGITIGGYLFILIVAVIVAIYYAAAAALNKHVYPSGFLVWGRFRVGYFFLLASLAVIVPQALTSIYGLSKPQEVPLFWLIPVAVTGCSILCYRRCWQGVFSGKKMVVIIISLVFSSLLSF